MGHIKEGERDGKIFSDGGGNKRRRILRQVHKTQVQGGYRVNRGYMEKILPTTRKNTDMIPWEHQGGSIP